MKLVIIFLSYILIQNIIDAKSKNSLEPKKVITYGQKAKEGQFPFQVSLRKEYKNYNECGGTLIDAIHVLTAAHCLLYIDSIIVELGMTQLNSTSKISIKSKKLFVHENFKFTKYSDDIAIVLLEKPVEFSETIKPAKLTYETVKPNTIALVSGWGNTTDSYPNDLMFTEAKIITNEECQKLIDQDKKMAETETEIDDGEVCAVSVGQGGTACHGDSGGPLSVDQEVIGVVSWSESPCDIKYPDVYMRVSFYKDWIQETLKRT